MKKTITVKELGQIYRYVFGQWKNKLPEPYNMGDILKIMDYYDKHKDQSPIPHR